MDDAFLESLPRRCKRELPAVNSSTVAIFSRLTLLARQHNLFHSEVLGRFKITHAEYVVLATLRFVGAPYRLSPTQLGKALRQTSPGVTKTVDRLERAGLIARSPALNDRRSLLVGLTPAGIETAARLFRAEMAAQRVRLKPLSPVEQRHILEAVRRLNRVFDFQPPTAATEQVTASDGERPRQTEAQRARRRSF
jgi:DNA-binding MarR family transcriptional regulator